MVFICLGRFIRSVDHPTLTKVDGLMVEMKMIINVFGKLNKRDIGVKCFRCVDCMRKGNLGFFQGKPMIGWRGATTGCERFGKIEVCLLRVMAIIHTVILDIIG